jgi:hypothetical protein
MQVYSTTVGTESAMPEPKDEIVRSKLIKTSARGLRNFTNYRARVLFHCGKLNMSLG